MDQNRAGCGVVPPEAGLRGEVEAPENVRIERAGGGEGLGGSTFSARRAVGVLVAEGAVVAVGETVDVGAPHLAATAHEANAVDLVFWIARVAVVGADLDAPVGDDRRGMRFGAELGRPENVFSGRRTSRAGCAPRRPGCATSADPMAAGPRPGAGRRREGLGGRGANGVTGGGGPWRGSTSEQRRRAKATMGLVGRRWPAANRDALPNGWRDRATRGAHAGAGRAAGWSGAAWPAMRGPTGRAFRLRGRPACRRL